MDDAIAQGLMDRSPIRWMPIGCHLLRTMANNSNCLVEKSFGSSHVPLLTRAGNQPKDLPD
jgi:hypothetical protein